MKTVLSFALIFITTSVFASVEYYVAPDGNDANPGTQSKPFITLEKARDTVRQIPKSEPVTVFLRGGTYRLNKPVVFTPEDSGTVDGPITYAAYPGEQPVISGGRAVSGWKVGADELWTVTLPEVAEGKAYYRQLFIGGKRASRTRLPEEGMYQVAAATKNPKREFQFKPGQIDPDWHNRDDVELVVLQHWTDARLRIESVDEKNHTVRFTGKTFRPSNWSRGWYVENVREGLTRPGQWYLDRTSGVLTYWPRKGETPETVQAILPVTRQWVRLTGDYKNDRHVEHLVFRGITFEHTAWDLDEKLGYSYPQAAISLTRGKPLWLGWGREGLSTPQSQVEVPAGFYAVGAHDISLEENTFQNTGAWGVHFDRGCKRIGFKGNTVEEMGAGGFRFGSPDATTDPSEEASEAAITDNVFRDGCSVYLGAPAVWIGLSSKNRIAHNEITGRWEWAISCGFQWGYLPPQNARENIIEYNDCHHVINRPLNTHAVIYLLGVQPGTMVRYNRVSYCDGAHGICLDNSAAMMTVENNVIDHGQRGAMVFNFNCLGNLIQNNIFAFSYEGQISRYGDQGEWLDQTGIFYRNIYYFKNDRPFNRPSWPNYDCIMDYNLYFDASGRPVTFQGLSLKEWQEQKKLDQHSIVADPLFVDPENGDFRLKPGSPALKLGFREIDLSRIGPRPKSQQK